MYCILIGRVQDFTLTFIYLRRSPDHSTRATQSTALIGKEFHGWRIHNLQDLTKQHGAKTILEDVNLSFFFGARIGVIYGTAQANGSWQGQEFMGDCIIAKHYGAGAPSLLERPFKKSSWKG